jgi:hypothetical protein
VKQFADFQKYLEPDETPLTQSLPKGRGWVVPDFCAKTKKQEVQPYMGIYDRIMDIIETVRPSDVDVEDEWYEYTPSEGMVKLRRLAYELGQSAYQEVDNPVYDEAACLAWKEENMASWTKIEWGTSKMVDVSQST